MCPGLFVRVCTLGELQMRIHSITCFSNWCCLCLCLCSRLGFGGRAGHMEDVQVCEVGLLEA